MRVLVKPNLLKATSPDKAVTTHPEFLRAAIRLLKAHGAATILVGDSPAFQGSAAAARAAGFWDMVREEGAEWVEFSNGAIWPAPRARLVKSFGLASQARDCDLILNLPKLKTHRLMLYTGAIKNLLGLVPGLGKSSMHLRFPDRGRFGTMLVDLASALPRVFSLMDAVVAMEGEGPGDGDPRHLGLVLASRESAWLDWTAAGIMGYDPRRLPYLVDALERTDRDPASPGLSVGPADFEASKASGEGLCHPPLRRLGIVRHSGHARLYPPLLEAPALGQADLPPRALHRLFGLRGHLSRQSPGSEARERRHQQGEDRRRCLHHLLLLP